MFFGFHFWLLGVTLLEPFHTSGGIDQLVFAGKEGVAFGANGDRDILDRRGGLNDVAAGAGDLHVMILGMNLLSHRGGASNMGFGAWQGGIYLATLSR